MLSIEAVYAYDPTVAETTLQTLNLVCHLGSSVDLEHFRAHNILFVVFLVRNEMDQSGSIRHKAEGMGVPPPKKAQNEPKRAKMSQK